MPFALTSNSYSIYSLCQSCIESFVVLQVPICSAESNPHVKQNTFPILCLGFVHQPDLDPTFKVESCIAGSEAYD